MTDADLGENFMMWELKKNKVDFSIESTYKSIVATDSTDPTNPTNPTDDKKSKSEVYLVVSTTIVYMLLLIFWHLWIHNYKIKSKFFLLYNIINN